MSTHKFNLVERFFRVLPVEVEAEDEDTAYDKAMKAYDNDEYETQFANCNLVLEECDVEWPDEEPHNHGGIQ